MRSWDWSFSGTIGRAISSAVSSAVSGTICCDVSVTVDLQGLVDDDIHWCTEEGSQQDRPVTDTCPPESRGLVKLQLNDGYAAHVRHS